MEFNLFYIIHAGDFDELVQIKNYTIIQFTKTIKLYSYIIMKMLVCYVVVCSSMSCEINKKIKVNDNIITK